MLRPRPAPVASLVELATGPGSAWSWSSLPPTAGSPQLLGHDLHGRAGAAVLGGPGPLLELAQDHDPAALRQRLGRVLGLVPPHDHGIERVRRTPHLAYSFLRRTDLSVS
jgi:hypothetical protein